MKLLSLQTHLSTHRRIVPAWTLALLLGLPFTPVNAEVKSAEPLRIAVVGDSLTEGLGVQKEEAYPALLQKKFEAAKLKVELINMGTSGATSASGPSRVRFALKMNPPPKVLFLALGANDALRGLDAEALKKNLTETVRIAQDAGLRVFVAGMKMPFNFPEAQRNRHEAVYREVVQERKTGFLPFILEGVAAQPHLNQPDQLHPTAEGHRKIADHVFPSLRKFLQL